MVSELDDIVEHLDRFRGVTLETLKMVADDELNWRPNADLYSLGQHLLHIAQAEDMYAKGLFEEDWNYERVRFPEKLPAKQDMVAFFETVRGRTMAHLRSLSPDRLGQVVNMPGSDLKMSLRSWLWFLVEHEMHHKAQAAVYLRLMGKVPPFYAMAMAGGARPDIAAREELGGF